ncbi:MAG: phosphoethanolamine--lipid A transferase [Pseudomonadales bacterium]|nr:phosphoethanolamine--lipid A transferase [Pseudomonadales bacterium]
MSQNASASFTQRLLARQLNPYAGLWLVVLFVTLTDNLTFFKSVLQFYPWSPEHLPFILSTFVLLVAVLMLLLLLFIPQQLIKPAGMLVLVLAASVAYYQDTFGIIMDEAMIRSILETNPDEAADVINPGMLLRIFLFGIVPAIILYRIPFSRPPFGRSLLQRAGSLALSVVLIMTCLLSFNGYYTSLFREHKVVRYYANPTTTFHALGVTATHMMMAEAYSDELIETPARLSKTPAPGKPRLIIMVVGEAARAGNFGINGYERDTTPLLANIDVLSFSDVTACGTTTAISVPCMFSPLGADDFSVRDASQRENLMDVLARFGVQVQWRDNNSDSKGVALRVPYASFKSAEVNPVCDVECRDTGMLASLPEDITNAGDKDQFIVLHQMGSHGPAYYKRYPEAFKSFTPVCASNELGQCSQQEIINAYDNSILYTDYFLSEVIGFLQQYSEQYRTAMIYVGDHGESLGENGLYLHGVPNLFAPDEQRKVPLVMWFSQDFAANREALARLVNSPVTHDDLFPYILSLFGILSEQTGLLSSPDSD